MHLGVDLETSSVKVVLVDGDGNQASEASYTLPISRPRPLWSKQSPQDWVSAAESAILAPPAKLRDDRKDATGPHQTWAMDFVHDQLATGRKIRILTVVDTSSRFSPVIDPRFSYRGEDVVETLERVCKSIGYPETIRVDQGSEFISRDLDLWAYQNDVTLDFSRPGKPTDNAFIEAFNGRLRAECLNTHWFLSMTDAREKLESWRIDYNEVRPHGAIGKKPPITLTNHVSAASLPT